MILVRMYLAFVPEHDALAKINTHRRAHMQSGPAQVRYCIDCL